mmetsp:Transcript_5374/g.9660  ORF Transcript_5374/g.9660 Transcript_5374/m.9660 type:complete len:89 (-) Transcript_5374:1321-1587(-)
MASIDAASDECGVEGISYCRATMQWRGVPSSLPLFFLRLLLPKIGMDNGSIEHRTKRCIRDDRSDLRWLDEALKRVVACDGGQHLRIT